MEIEFEIDDSGDNISDGDADSIYCTGTLLTWQAWWKMGSMCVLLVGAWRLWGWGKLFFVPHVQKKCKIVSYIMKYLLSHIRTPFLFWRKVTCPHIFCSETCMLLQTVFIMISQ